MKTLYKYLNFFRFLDGRGISSHQVYSLPTHTKPDFRSSLSAQQMKYRKFIWAFVLCTLTSMNGVQAFVKPPMANFGASNYPCNTKMPWVDSSFTGLSSSVIDPAADGLACLGSNTNLGNLRNNSLSDFASINFFSGLGGCSSTLSVVDTDVSDTYPVGTFAGYRIGTAGLVGISIGLNITISTYNNGSFVESQTVVSSGLGLNSSLINGDGTATLGFVTTMGAFDEIRITYTAAVALLFTGTVYHAVVQRYCAGPSLACNVQTRMNNPTFPTLIGASNTGLSGGVCVGCSVNNTENAVSSSATDFATIVLTAALGTTGSIAVKDQLTDYPAGTFAGFDISNPNLVNANLLSGITIRTYKNGAPREASNSGTLLSVGSTLLTGAGKQTVGFVTTLDFDEVKIEVTNLLGVLSTTNVYGAVFQSFCVGPDLPCNTLTSMATPTYPVLVAGPNTGTSGIACVLCSVDSTNNLIDNIPNNSARINLTAGIGAIGSIAVRDQLTDYPAGTFVAFDIENTALLDVDLLDGITISTYLNGNPVAVESQNGQAALLSVSTDLLTNSGRRTVGFVTTAPFDEVRLIVSNTVSVNLGITRVYNVFFEKFCPVVLECNTTNYLNGPDFPVIINDERTGVDGIACVACSVEDAPYVITADPNDYAVITTVVGALSPASIAVKDVLSTFPAGSTAGFVIRDINTLLQVELFNSITITTYNDGIPQESAAGSGLLDLAVLNLLNLSLTGPGDFNIGFRTTLPYDEIQISVGSLASVINIIQVYGAFVDTRGANDGTLNCCPTTAPNLSANTLSNTCPAVTVDLNSLVTNIPPMGADFTVVWFTNNGATGTAYPTPGAATAGTYYAFFYDNIDNCYGPASGAVTVTINTCPPVITSNGGGPSANISVPENTTPVTTVTATDPENGTLTYSISGGADAAMFSIDPMTGALSFISPKDFENPTDVGGNNVYDVQVTATDPSNATDVQDIAVTVTDLDENGQLLVKVLLQGALFNSPNPGVMRDNLRSGNHIPLNDPYTGSGNPRFAHAGTGGAASTTSGVLAANAGTDNAIVDWVFVELRSAAEQTVVVETRAALLQRDGDVVSPADGTSPLALPGTAGNSYFIAVKHRNHLGVMTATERTITLAGITVDFRTMSDADVYHTSTPFSYDGYEMVTVSGFRALWAGNANGDKKVKYQGPSNDNATVLAQVLGFPGNGGIFNYDLAIGYFSGDLNMDAKVKYQGTTNDPGFMFLNLITNFVLNTLDLYNFDLFSEQIP